jgi:membrane protease YdiL (CAAX protease family)
MGGSLAIINGVIEEIYWRGLYLKEFHHNIWLGFFLSSLLFAMWHISLWFARGIKYQSGMPALVGAALMMGFLWSFVARKAKNINTCITAHCFVDVFAFTCLFVGNGW